VQAEVLEVSVTSPAVVKGTTEAGAAYEAALGRVGHHTQDSMESQDVQSMCSCMRALRTTRTRVLHSYRRHRHDNERH
jgi:hypothetical protein